MRRYFKRTIAVLAIALMCSTLVGGGVLAENESENDFNDELTVEETDRNEDVPEGEPGTVSGETVSEELETNVEEARSALAGAVSPQSDECPVKLTLKSNPTSGYESFPVLVDLGNTIEYYVRVDNIHDNDDLTDVEVKIHVDDSLEPDVSTAKYNLTTSLSEANKHPISGSSGYSVRQEGNDIIFKANQLSWDETVMFHITCNTKSEGIVSSKASVCSVGGVSYSGIESSSTYHNVRQEVSDFSLSTSIVGSNHQYIDRDRVFTYNFNLIKNGRGLTASLPYKLMSGSTVVSEHTLELENGIGSVSFPARYQFKTESMPTGVNYQITHKADESYTWDKEFVNDTTDLGGSNESFNATYKYSLVKYSLDTNIIVEMKGRAFKAGDSFTYSIAPEKEGDPIFNMFPLPSGDSDAIAYYENSARIKPSSGTTATLSLAEDIQYYNSVCAFCGNYYKTNAERRFYCQAADCFEGYSISGHNINVAPEICFLYPGTYNYIVFQTAMESSDYDSIQQDSAQYKVTVTVSANGSNLTPSLTSVKKSTDGGKTWVPHQDKSNLTFTNEKIDGVVKGDIDKSGKVDLDDLMICLEHVAEQKLLTGESFIRADIDSNGKVDIDDLMRILDYVNEVSTTL